MNHPHLLAARLLPVSPPLTAQIQQLEDAVGAALFERNNRINPLTAAALKK